MAINQYQNNFKQDSNDNQAIIVALICFLILVIIDIFLFWALNLKYSADFKEQATTLSSPLSSETALISR